MKKLGIGLLCLVLLVGLTACGGAEPSEETPTTTTTTTTTAAGDTTTTTTKPATDTTVDNGDTTTTGGEDTTSTTTVGNGDTTTKRDPSATVTTKKPTDKTTTTTKKPTDKNTTTTTKKTTDKDTTKQTTTTTEKTTTTTKPVVVTPTLPAVGTDIDTKNPKGRIKVSAATYEKNADGTFTVSLTFTNYTSNWITEETDWVMYTCYGADGAVVQKATKMYIGCIDTKGNKEKTFTFTVPAGTAEVKLTDSKIVYWTEWS